MCESNRKPTSFMIQILVSLVLLTVIPLSSACVIPAQGEQYNKQIQLIRLPDANAYRFVIPASMEGLNKLDVSLAYARPREGGFKLAEIEKPLAFTVTSGLAVGKFVASKESDVKPYLRAMWWPDTAGLCGVVAVSEFIDSTDDS